MSVSMLMLEVLNRIDAAKLIEKAPASLSSNVLFKMAAAKGVQMLPPIKRLVMSTMMAYGVVVEVAPLLCALLMAGQIGGGHTGHVATLASNGEADLLQTMGVSQAWRLVPAFSASILSAPILSWCCALAALAAAAFVCRGADFEAAQEETLWQSMLDAAQSHNLRGGRMAEKGWDTWLPAILLYRSVGFHVTISLVSEFWGRQAGRQQSRRVGSLITVAVVTASLACLTLDWAYSRILVSALVNTAVVELKFPL
eukprot:c7762_g1_i1.p1 GENE.c7762_g1_i1~~c7762_g1_i1.p1  ORF type:complete len:255 (+),score=38.69 c7762_g1_i1:929-1693(+)